LTEAAAAVKTKAPGPFSVGVVLGSGLGAFGDTLEDLVKIPYTDIPHVPSTSVQGHAGALCLGTLGGAPVACLQGRSHLYEGYDAATVTFGVRLLAQLGCHTVLLTNAAGSLHHALQPGDLMLLTDHLNLSGDNPLLGPNDEALGPRFPDMTEIYDSRLREQAIAVALKAGITLRPGVYAALQGPSYETPAEVRMLRLLGADAVGMSTALEAIALRHQGVRVGAVSCITNLGAGLSSTPLSHADVEATATRVRPAFVSFLRAWAQAAAEPIEP